MDTPIKRPFWVWVFCESDGTPSSSRVFTAVLIAFACGWITAIVATRRTIPEMGGLVALVSTIYGANKVATHFGNKDKP